MKDVIDLASALIRIPTVTVGERVRFDAVRQAADFICNWLSDAAVAVRRFDGGEFPAILAGFPGGLDAPVMLSGHYDVVAPEPDDTQFIPRIEGDYLWGRGAADMKTVVATYMVWLRDAVRRGPPHPRVNLLLVGNEEMGEGEPVGSGHALGILQAEGYQPELFVAGERTEESGTQLWGQVCTENRGVVRFRVVARGVRAHSGMDPQARDLSRALFEARERIETLAARLMTLEDPDGWKSQLRFPFMQVGIPGVYNITPDHASLGVEIRSIPGDRPEALIAEIEGFAAAAGLEVLEKLVEPGSSCDRANRYLRMLLSAVREASGEEPVIGRKMAGTSARFAPGGDGVVWGQSGIGPHSAGERHYLPSIAPYYRALDLFGEKTMGLN